MDGYSLRTRSSAAKSRVAMSSVASRSTDTRSERLGDGWTSTTTTTTRSVSTAGMQTPEVRRTLDLADYNDEEEEDEDEDYEPVYRSSTYRQQEEHEDDESDAFDEEDEEFDEEELQDEDEEGEEEERRLRRSTLNRRAAAAAAFFNQRSAFASRVTQQISSWTITKKVAKNLRRLWRFIVRNSFMAVNVLWLLAPLCCFGIAIAVPQYLTAAIRYVDNITLSVSGAQAGLGAYEKGAMRTIVQELVDVKLSSMNNEIAELRKALEVQERDVEALRLLHESFRQVHDDAQRSFSLVDAGSALSVHIERVVGRYSDELWAKVITKTSQIEQQLHETTNQQTAIEEAIKDQQEDIDDLQNIANTAPAKSSKDSTAASDIAMYDQAEIKKELRAWRDSLQQELQRETQRELQSIEDRMSKALLAEKEILDASARSFRSRNAADPALLAVVEDALAVAEAKRIGRVDYAALANGASIIYSEQDLLHPDEFVSFEAIGELVGLGSARRDSRFTSPSYRNAPSSLSSVLSSCEHGPWWLSRHNGRPETALSETMEVGSCWGMAGTSGRLSVKFAHQIVVDAVSIEHIPAQIAADFSSAPHEFQIWGIAGNPLRDTVSLIPFGNFSYSRNDPARQTFKLTSPASQRTAVDGVALAITSNHGNPEFTCLYRFQVHGQVVE